MTEDCKAVPTLATLVAHDTTVSIIGSAARNADFEKVTQQLFELMVEDAKQRLSRIAPSKKITLFSGGATFADHVAVVLYLTGNYAGLILYLPRGQREGLHPSNPATAESSASLSGSVQGTISFTPKRRKVDTSTASADAKVRCSTFRPRPTSAAAAPTTGGQHVPFGDGARAVELHERLMLVIERDTLSEIELAISRGAKVVERSGFLERNKDVAKGDHLIAYTFSPTGAGSSAAPSSAGTLSTWNHWAKQHPSDYCYSYFGKDSREVAKFHRSFTRNHVAIESLLQSR
jgi:hypothetical protein